MSEEELYKALKMFNREDLTYENDDFFNDFEEYMNTMKQEKAIEVFMSTEDMIKYSKLEQEIDKLVDTNEDINREFSRYKYESKKEIERLNNIIDELEKWLDTIPNYFMDSRSNNNGVYIQKGMKQQIDMTKQKIKELKGEDKE